VSFRGWPVEAIEFFEGLADDNTKVYWQDHKAVYEECVRAPMDALLAELEPEFGAGRIFRPYRDVRYARDKSPYKTNIGATLAGGGYVQLSADGLAVGTGLYRPEPAALARYRAAVADRRSGPALVRLVSAARASGLDVTAPEILKTAPRGYPMDHPRIDLLRQKGLIVWREWPVAAWLGTRKAKARVVEVLHGAAPIARWLDRHVAQARSSV